MYHIFSPLYTPTPLPLPPSGADTSVWQEVCWPSQVHCQLQGWEVGTGHCSVRVQRQTSDTDRCWK